MTGLSALAFIGGLATMDADDVDMTQDRYVVMHSLLMMTGLTMSVRRIDWLGAFLVTAGLVLILFVLAEGSIAPQGWRTNCERLVIRK